MEKSEKTIRALMAAFEVLDFEALYALVDDNLVYQNMPQAPIHGKAALRALFSGFGSVTEIRFELRGFLAKGDVVLTEHLDHMLINGKRCIVPMMSSYRLKNGKVAEWREYYDMPTFERQLGRVHPGAKGGH